MKKGTPKSTEAVLVGTRVSPETRDQFAEVARANSRSVAGELRILIERRVLQEMERAA